MAPVFTTLVFPGITICKLCEQLFRSANDISGTFKIMIQNMKIVISLFDNLVTHWVIIL